MHIYGIQKNGTEEFIYRAAMEKPTQRIDLWTWERGEEDEMYGKSNMETYITICKRESQNHRICSMTQETQTGALYQYRGAGWGGR